MSTTRIYFALLRGRNDRPNECVSWSVTKYNQKYPVNATAQIEQVQDKKTVTGRRRNTIKTLIGTFILYCKIQECRLTVETAKWRQASSIHLSLKCK
jgi:hypothetical protein